METNKQDKQNDQDWRPSDRRNNTGNREDAGYGYREGHKRSVNPRGTIKDQMFQALNERDLSPEAKVQALAAINNTLTMKFLIERQNLLFEDIGKQLNRMNGLFDSILERMEASTDQESDLPDQNEQLERTD